MNTLVARYSPPRSYLLAGVAAAGLAAFSWWWSQEWIFAVVPAVLFLVTSAVLLFFALRPVVEVHETHLAIGSLRIGWSDILRVDRTGWISPLLVYLTLADNSRVPIIFAGDLDSSNSLLRQLRRQARFALIDGIPYRQFWGEGQRFAERQPPVAPRYRLLREEDEAEVERMFQRLKSVGRLDPKSSDE